MVSIVMHTSILYIFHCIYTAKSCTEASQCSIRVLGIYATSKIAITEHALANKPAHYTEVITTHPLVSNTMGVL